MSFIKNPHTEIRLSNFLQSLGIFPRDYISIFDEPEKQILKLSKYKPDVIRTWTSCLSVLARQYDPSLNISPRMIFTSAEILNDYTRKYIEKTFNSEIFDHYACEEFGLIGWECGKHDGYHINSDSLIIEFLKDDAPVGNNEKGEVVVTHLDNYAMPFIRYKLGDIGVGSDVGCSCGLNLPKIRFIEGRNDDFLVALNGNWVSPRTISDVLEYSTDDYKGLIHYKIEQVEREKIIIKIQVNELFNSDESFHKIVTNMKKYLGGDMDVDVQIVDDIPIDKSGKISKVTSRIKTN
jgi:phenylacetate-CoA ligase